MYLLMTAASPTSALPGPAARQHQHQLHHRPQGSIYPHTQWSPAPPHTHQLLMSVAKQVYLICVETEAPWCAPLQLWRRWCGGGCPFPPLSMPPTVPLRPRTLQQQPTLTNTRQHHEIATSPHYTELTPLCHL